MGRIEQSATLRQGLLALVMLGVLLLSVTAAWLLGRESLGRVEAGTKIIQSLRKQKLDSVWGEKPVVAWYLIRKGDAVVGWRARVRVRLTDGNYAGATVDARRHGDIARSTWRLTPDLQTGRYRSIIGEADVVVTIELDDGRVTVQQVVPKAQAELAAQSPTPPNYLAEDTLELAAALVAQRKADAQFRIVYDQRLNRRGQVEFASLHMTYLGQRVRDGQTFSQVRVQDVQAGAESAEIMDIAADGQVARIESADVGIERVDLPAVQREFENAQRLFLDTLPPEIRQQLNLDPQKPLDPNAV